MPETDPDELIDLYVDGRYWGTVTRRELVESRSANEAFQKAVHEELIGTRPTTEHDDLIRRLRAESAEQRTWAENDDDPVGTDAWKLADLLAEAVAALEARPSLVAESREALIEWYHERMRGDCVHATDGHRSCEQAADALLAGPVRVADAIRAEVIAWIADGDSTPSIRRSVKNAREHFGLDGFTRKEQNDGE